MVPMLNSDCTIKVPPIRRALSRIPIIPNFPDKARSLVLCGMSNPLPLSLITRVSASSPKSIVISTVEASECLLTLLSAS